MCYRISADVEKDARAHRLSSDKTTAFTPVEDRDRAEIQPLTSITGFTAMVSRLFGPPGKETGKEDFRQYKDIEKTTDETTDDDKRELESVR